MGESNCWDHLEFEIQPPQWSRACHAGREGGNERGSKRRYARALEAGEGEGSQRAACICDWSFRPMGMRSTDTAGGGWNGRGAELVLGRRWWGWRGAFGNQPQRQSGLLRQLPSQSLLEQRERGLYPHTLGWFQLTLLGCLPPVSVCLGGKNV